MRSILTPDWSARPSVPKGTISSSEAARQGTDTSAWRCECLGHERALKDHEGEFHGLAEAVGAGSQDLRLVETVQRQRVAQDQGVWLLRREPARSF